MVYLLYKRKKLINTKENKMNAATRREEVRIQALELFELIGSAGFLLLPQDIKDRIYAQYEMIRDACLDMQDKIDPEEGVPSYMRGQ
jgi:hypothetical protein